MFDGDIMKNTIKTLTTVLVASSLILVGCSTGDNTSPSILSGDSSSTSTQFNASPGDTVSLQTFTSLNSLNSFIEKSFNITETKVSEEEAIITFVTGNLESKDNIEYIIFENSEGIRASFYYSQVLQDTGCSPDVVLNFTAFQNLEDLTPDTPYFSFKTLEEYRSTVFNNINAYEAMLTPDLWAVNGRNLFLFSGEDYIRVVTFNETGALTRIADYVSNFHPTYGIALNQDFLYDEQGNIIFDPETGEPQFEEFNQPENVREEIIRIISQENFQLENLLSVTNPYSESNIFYNKEAEIVSFKGETRTTEFWLNAAKEIINNPDYYATNYAASPNAAFAVATDGTILGYHGDIYSGLNLVNLNDGSNNIILSDGSTLTCTPPEDPFADLQEDEFGVIGSAPEPITDPEILGFDPNDNNG